MKGNNSAQITNLNSSETDDPNIIFSSILFRAHFSLSSTLTLPLTLTRVLERELFGAHVGNTFRSSGFTRLYPAVSENKPEVAHCLMDWISNFGIPGVLMSDQGPVSRTMSLLNCATAFCITIITSSLRIHIDRTGNKNE